jgi:hypothetical protein
LPSPPVVAPTCDEITTANVNGTAAARLLAGLRELSLTELPAMPSIDVIFEDLESVLGEHAEVAQEDWHLWLGISTTSPGGSRTSPACPAAG